jgi:hypothetical protein
MRRFYEPLVLQHVLGHTRGSRIPCEQLRSEDGSELDDCTLRRSFVDSLAYLCDYEKGGPTVTAIALESTPEGVVFWAAANQNVRKKVDPFLHDILKVMAGLGRAATEESLAAAEASTFRRAVNFGRHRVKTYWRFMQEPLEKCLKALGRYDSDKGELVDLQGSYLDNFTDNF